MNILQTTLENYADLFGYRSVETPIFEPVDAFLTKAGNQVFNKLITFELNRTVMALRPEFTASIAQQISTETDLPKRFQCSGSIFHHDILAPNNLTNQQSFGIELIGLDGPFADAEIIALAALSLENLGIYDYQIVVGHVGLTRSLLESFGLSKRLFRYLLNKRLEITSDVDVFLASLKTDFEFDPQSHTHDSKHSEIIAQQMLYSTFKRTNMPLGSRTNEDIVTRLGEKQQSAMIYDRAVAAVRFLQDWSAITGSIEQTKDLLKQHINDEQTKQVFSDWMQSLDFVQNYGIDREKLIIKPDLARTWDYYTGMVFEINLKDKTYIGGGGRYNDLIQLLNEIEEQIPAIGFAFNLDTISSVLSHAKKEQKIFSLVCRSGVGDENLIAWSRKLRHYNIPIQSKSKPDEDTSNTIIIDNQYATYQNVQFSIDEIDALVSKIKEESYESKQLHAGTSK